MRLGQHEIRQLFLGTESETREYERREARRYSYSVTQLVAPFDGTTTPKKSAFQEVRCHDVSTKGIAFFQHEPPDFEHVVIGLGMSPKITYLVARVIHTTPCDDPSDGFRIGCQFVGRVGIIPD